MYSFNCKVLVIVFLTVLPPGKGLQTLLAQNYDPLEQFRQQIVLPVAETSNCTLNACHALKLVSQLLVLLQTTLPSSNSIQKPAQPVMSNDQDTRYDQLHTMVHQIESRLRSVEQPVWRLALGNRLEWNHCTSGGCRCNPDTKTFTCWNSNLKSVPVTQVIPLNMVSIDLSRNALSTLHRDTFRGLTSLKVLDLSRNQLDFLPFDIFHDLDSLSQLRIQGNFLDELDYRIFWKLRHLSLLDLSKNHLTNLHEQLFHHCQRLTLINLSDNKIRTFPPNLLRDQQILEELDMSRNELQFLKTGGMLKLEKLIVLDFSSNSIASISEDFFAGLISLRTLILNNNQLTNISSTIFKNLNKLITLDLSMNRITKIHNRAFEELVNLKELFLGQNDLSHIPDGLFLNLKSLIRLSIYSNNLTTLESVDFEGLTSVRNLMLHNNNLKYINSKVFASFKNLEKLRIDSNKLQYLPHGSFAHLHKLISVKLDKNPWYCDCRALYLARWIREHNSKLWDTAPLCHGPTDMNNRELGLLRYDDLCGGQWASMLALSPRLPVRKNHFSPPMNYTDYFNIYLKHIYTSSPDLQDKIDPYKTTERSSEDDSKGGKS
ncbi:uncharacterized protein ACRADG_002539 [Cochliomyia hominivorax]